MIKKNVLIQLYLLLIAALGFSQNGVYTFDEDQSKVQFEVGHMGFLKAKGSYELFDGTISFENGSFKEAVMKVEVNSFFTGNDKRDDNMRSEAYLDPETYPLVEFETVGKQENSTIKGNLTIKGVSSTIEFPYEIEYDSQTDTFILTAETTINRKDFNLIFDSMNGLIGNRIKLNFVLVCKK